MNHVMVYYLCRKALLADRLQDAPVPIDVAQEVLKYPPKPSQVYAWMMECLGYYDSGTFKDITGRYWHNRPLKRPVKPYMNPALKAYEESKEVEE